MSATSTEETNEQCTLFSTSHQQTPNKDQAIVIDTIDGVPQTEYVFHVAMLVSPSDILYASYISRRRFCIFLSSKTIVDELIESQATIIIQKTPIIIHRLISTSKKIIITNVCPTISNELLLAELKKNKIIPTSDIIELKLNINHEKFKHIKSFRRQMYVNRNDVDKIPLSMDITHENTECRVYFTKSFISKPRGNSNQKQTASSPNQSNNVASNSGDLLLTKKESLTIDDKYKPSNDNNVTLPAKTIPTEICDDNNDSNSPFKNVNRVKLSSINNEHEVNEILKSSHPQTAANTESSKVDVKDKPFNDKNKAFSAIIAPTIVCVDNNSRSTTPIKNTNSVMLSSINDDHEIIEILNSSRSKTLAPINNLVRRSPTPTHIPKLNAMMSSSNKMTGLTKKSTVKPHDNPKLRRTNTFFRLN